MAAIMRAMSKPFTIKRGRFVIWLGCCDWEGRYGRESDKFGGLPDENKTHASLKCFSILGILTIINGFLSFVFLIFTIGGAFADYVGFISAGVGLLLMVIGTLASLIVFIFSKKLSLLVAGIVLLHSILTFCGLMAYLPEVITARY